MTNSKLNSLTLQPLSKLAIMEKQLECSVLPQHIGPVDLSQREVTKIIIIETILKTNDEKGAFKNCENLLFSHYAKFSAKFIAKLQIVSIECAIIFQTFYNSFLPSKFNFDGFLQHRVAKSTAESSKNVINITKASHQNLSQKIVQFIVRYIWLGCQLAGRNF